MDPSEDWSEDWLGYKNGILWFSQSSAVRRNLATYWGVGPIGDFVVILPSYLFDPSKISKIELDFKLLWVLVAKLYKS